MTRRAKKALGQHFLTDPVYCRRIVHLADVRAGDLVVEIGPGTGLLTEALLRAGARVLAVELDGELFEQLRRDLLPRFPSRLQLFHDDILRFDWGQLPTPQAAKMVANLPYYISTAILEKMTGVRNRFQSLTVMLQREVALRLLASPGSKDYGYLTLLLTNHFEIRYGFDVPAGAFQPPPKVISSVLQLRPRPAPLVEEGEEEYVQWLRLSFRHRRKTLWNNLRPHVPRERLEEAFQVCRIPSRARPEELTLQQYACLSRVL